MKYFLDTEFHEYEKKPLFSKAINTIELISIGVVSEDDREYYAVCNEFDLKAAWSNDWLKEKVLKPIWIELNQSMSVYHKTYFYYTTDWSYKGMRRLLKWRGKSSDTIAREIELFTLGRNDDTPEFYAYYADYDWVVFCWLFGRMIDLPKGFPMYCNDLKQLLDVKVNMLRNNTIINEPCINVASFDTYLREIKNDVNYPEQENEHNALDDAKWNKELYKFLT